MWGSSFIPLPLAASLFLLNVAATPISGDLADRASSTLSDCLNKQKVPIRLASDSDWATYQTTYNARLQYAPAVIALPETAQHISDAVVCAGKKNIKVQAKSGGHSYASFSTGGQDGILMIDLENFNQVSVDSKGIAKVGGGVRLGNLALAIYNQGKRALSHGTCPGVGIGGHFTHGGFGYSSRAWGLAMDQIVALDVVLANGTYVQANASSYPDIFYAMRGAADSFGIAVNFYLQTQAAPTTVINWSYSIPDALANVTAAISAFRHIQDVSMDSSIIDRNMGLGMFIANGGGPTFTIQGTYFGTLKSFKTKFATALLNGLPTPKSSSIQAVDWITSLKLLGGTNTLETPLHGYSERDNFFAKSVTIPSALSNTALRSFFNFVIDQGRSAPVDWFSIINLYGGPDSQINAKDVNFAAYNDRDSLWVVQNYGSAAVGSTFPQQGVQFVNNLNSALTSKLKTYGAYLNYVDPTLSSDEAHQMYYGQQLYARLKTIKNVVDPKNVFSNPQSI